MEIQTKPEWQLVVKVLIGMDFSQVSHYVVDEAVARPWPVDTAFLVLHVMEAHHFAGAPTFLDEAKREAEAQVKTVADKLINAGHKSESAVIVGFPRTAILEHAREWDADLVMVGSRGQAAVARFMLGSVAQATLRMAPCSVEIVRENAYSLPGSSSQSMRILLTTDGSEFSTAAAESVAQQPWPTGTQIKILSVEELPVPEYPATASAPYPTYPPSLLLELMDSASAHAKRSVENARKILLAARLDPLENKTTPLGNPRVLILDQAAEWEADLIVLGSHGRRGMERWMLGSVSESVALYAHCSVEVVRSKT
jgi:nucleotide-binding universal stress UspA family protein